MGITPDIAVETQAKEIQRDCIEKVPALAIDGLDVLGAEQRLDTI